ncbi:MAG: hypothetical protein IJ587_11465 [Synergistaceae bacterium]|nr:hypothetical protein [Synergistaceae bacterium]
MPKQFLVTAFLSASKSLTMYILKLILLLAGCNAGFGAMGGGAVIIAVSFIAARRQRKKR